MKNEPIKNKFLKDTIFLVSVLTGELYDYNIKTKNLSKVLKCYTKNDIINYERFDYAYYKNDYKIATQRDLLKNANSYYLEEGLYF